MIRPQADLGGTVEHGYAEARRGAVQAGERDGEPECGR